MFPTPQVEISKSLRVADRGKIPAVAPSKKPNVLQARVTARLSDLQRNPFEAARLGELERGFVNDILNGKKQSVRGANLNKLSFALDCDIAYLLGSQDAPKAFLELGEPGVVVFRGETAAGLFVDIGIDGGDGFDPRPSVFPPDGRYPTAAQFDLIVRGSSINEFAADGAFLRCVDLDALRRKPVVNDMVVLDRMRGDLRERTAKRLKHGSDGQWEFHCESNDPRWLNSTVIVDPETGETPEGDIVKVFGVVLYSFRLP